VAWNVTVGLMPLWPHITDSMAYSPTLARPWKYLVYIPLSAVLYFIYRHRPMIVNCNVGCFLFVSVSTSGCVMTV